MDRIQIDAVEPNAYQGMMALEDYLEKSGISQSHKDLIKVRASQINGCAFCINMHTKEAIKHGESVQRLFLLDGWKHTDHFTEEEQVILQMTEELTLIHERGLAEETYLRALKYFDASYFSQIVMAAVTINSWNRIAISTHKPF